jgi:hypothetical protein
VDLKGTIFDGLSPEMQTKIAPFAVAFNENGTLTDAEITEAAHATGMTEAVVKQFMAGADKEVGNLAADAAPVFEVFDGPDGYKEFQAWTNEAGNLTEPEKRSINKALGIGPDGKLIEGAKPDYETAAQLMQAPAARWKEAGGGPTPRDVTKGKAAGAAAGAEAGDSYANWAQVQADMSKKEYRTDAQRSARRSSRKSLGPAHSPEASIPSQRLSRPRGQHPDDLSRDQRSILWLTQPRRGWVKLMPQVMQLHYSSRCSREKSSRPSTEPAPSVHATWSAPSPAASRHSSR